jgi:hypothetical protein
MLETIGCASKTDDFSELKAIIFEVPYGPEPYNVAIKDQELDQVLASGAVNLCGGTAVRSFFDFEIALCAGDLPLFVGVREVRIDSISADMELSVVTKSMVYEHRGILSAHRNVLRSWSKICYQTQPPLQEPKGIAY